VKGCWLILVSLAIGLLFPVLMLLVMILLGLL